MAKTLILTGWGHTDYAVAAALALRHYKNDGNTDVDVLGMSKRRLPEFLNGDNRYAEIVILGVGLDGDPDTLLTSLRKQCQRNVTVRWISAIDFPEVIGEETRKLLKWFVSPSESIANAVAEYYKMDPNPLARFLDMSKPMSRKYEELKSAAEYRYRNFQDDNAYPDVIRHLEAEHSEAQWSQSEQHMLNEYRLYGHRELIGKSQIINDLQAGIDSIGDNDHARVLILGESGTGKDTVATLIHLKSKRGKNHEPFVCFNCASVAPELLESRFLGHEKGAFTGATERKAGLFEEANGGTLFLDEIGELPLEAQGVILRVLEEGRFQRLGQSDSRDIKVDVRVIAATNRNLAEMVRDGKFRFDLYFRLCVIQIFVPPLREHKEDIPDIAYYFRRRNNIKPHRLTDEQERALQSYDYPGNVRELYNLLERAAVLKKTDFADLISEHKRINAPLMQKQSSLDCDIPDNLEEATRLHVKRVYEKYGNNVSQAATALGVARNTVRKYI